ncbi:MAG: hypothetical protein Q8R67_06695 [Rhodoferax sp.]|nr:hypothetical protein [Rhodoferax sp.]MDP3651354.1 hypothetical protein [Rhodoferax sp.]
MLNRLEKFGLNLVVFAKLLGTTTVGLVFISFLIINGRSIRLSRREWIFIGAVLFQFFISLFLSLNIALISNTLFYFSFLPVYVFLKNKNNQILIYFLRYLMVVMFVFCLVEFIFLNTSLNKFVWYFTDEHMHRSLIMGLQRAQGLAAISSSSGSVAVLSLALYSIVSNRQHIFYYVIVFFTIVLLMSGTGFFIFAAYILLINLINARGVFGKLLVWLFILTVFSIFLWIFEDIGLNKFTLTYFFDILNFKGDQYLDFEVKKSLVSIVFGGQADSRHSVVETSSDFGIMGLYNSMGVFSVVLAVFSPLLLIGFQKKYIVVLILLLLSWVHYPALGSPVGCVFLGLFLALYRGNQRIASAKVRPGFSTALVS